MKTSAIGLGLIKRFERCVLYVYDDATGAMLAVGEHPRGVATIGWGHAVRAGETWPGNRITLAQADALLARDLEWAEAAVSRTISVPLTQAEFDALVSFTYNIGSGALAASSVRAHLDQGDRVGAADALLYYDRLPTGAQSPGLLARRRAERSLFLSDLPTAPATPIAITRIEGTVAPVLADDIDEPDPASEPEDA